MNKTFENFDALTLTFTKQTGGEFNEKKREFSESLYEVTLTNKETKGEFSTKFTKGGGNIGIKKHRENSINPQQYKPYYGRKIHLNTSYRPVTEAGIILHAIPPQLAEVLYSLQVDCQVGAETHGEFCSNLGYDPDSIKAQDIYRCCQVILDGMHKLLRGGFDEFMKLREEGGEEEEEEMDGTE